VIGFEQQANRFALDLMETLAGVLPRGDLGIDVAVSGGRGPLLAVVRQSDPDGISLDVEGEEHLRLILDLKCVWNSTQRYLGVRDSTFELRLRGTTEPLLRYDYLRDSGEGVPSAHINVHAHRDEMVMALIGSGRRHRGKSRIKALDDRRTPKLSQLHLPVGGHRFRPSLEDVLEMVVKEFGIDVRPDSYRAAIDAGRERFRARQVASAIGDDPASAAEALRALGYTVLEGGKAPSVRLDRVRAL